MTKFLNTALVTLLLSSCSAQEETDTKVSNPTQESIQKALLDSGMTQKESETKTAVSTVAEVKKAQEEKIKKEAVKKKKEAPALEKNVLTVTTLDGKKIHVDEATGGLTFQEFKDKAVMVIFFGYRCPPCLAEIPSLIELQKKKHPDLEILAIEVQGLNEQQLSVFTAKKGLNYHIAPQTKENGKFVNYIASRAQWGGSIPFLIAFDPKGEVKVVHVGGLREAQLNDIYTSLTSKK